MLRAFLLMLIVASPLWAKDISVTTDAQFQAALKNAKPGDHVRLGPGPFKGGFFAVGVSGTKEKPIRISGSSVEKPAVIDSVSNALQLVSSSFIEIENLHIVRAVGHGLAFDDGGKNDWSCHDIAVRNVRIEDVGEKAGTCSIKMAGVSDFSISDSSFRNWGVAGCAVDGVGCRKGIVERCTMLRGRGNASVQFKGGSESIVIRGCTFDDLVSTGINIGGSSGLVYFRPRPMEFEARNIVVEGNLFTGCDAAIVFGNADGADVRFNTIYVPTKWAFRILQMQNAEGFTPCRNGRIEDNIIVFKLTQWLEGGINIGPGTAPETFTFARNAWYCVDAPTKSAPKLPTKELDGLVGKDPMFVDPMKKDFSLKADSPAKGRGHLALPR